MERETCPVWCAHTTGSGREGETTGLATCMADGWGTSGGARQRSSKSDHPPPGPKSKTKARKEALVLKWRGFFTAGCSKAGAGLQMPSSASWSQKKRRTGSRVAQPRTPGHRRNNPRGGRWPVRFASLPAAESRACGSADCTARSLPGRVPSRFRGLPQRSSTLGVDLPRRRGPSLSTGRQEGGRPPGDSRVRPPPAACRPAGREAEDTMPTGTTVDDAYRAILAKNLKKGVPKRQAEAHAARIAQAATGLSLATGKPPKSSP